MGMYDVVLGHVRCPYCNNIEGIEEQIKWTNDPIMCTYLIGERIDAADGIYDYATGVRNELSVNCNNCSEDMKYFIQVKNGRFRAIIQDKTDASKEKIDKVRDMLKQKHNKMINNLLEKAKQRSEISK